jgi:hypothetical protein
VARTAVEPLLQDRLSLEEEEEAEEEVVAAVDAAESS